MSRKSGKGFESKARVLLNLLSDPAVVVDQNGLLLIVNDEFEKITGLTRQKIIGTPFFNYDILPSESKKLLMENLSRRLQGLPIAPYEISFIDSSGNRRFMEVKGKQITFNRQPADLVVFHDITHRKENAKLIKEYAEQMETLVEQKIKEIKENEEKFRAITTCAKDAIITVRADGTVAYWNPAAERIFGYAEQEAVGKNLLNLIISPQHRGFKRIFIEKIENLFALQNETVDFIAIRKDGTEFPAELSATLMNFKGETCLLIILRDVSERKKMEDAIRQKHDMLEAITRSVGAVLAVIGKDYRILWANENTRRLKGDVVGKLCYATFNTLNAPCPDCGVKKIFENGVDFDSHEYCPPQINGKQIWVQIIATPIKDENGNVTAAAELAIDITEQKKTLEDLKNAEERYKQLFNTITSGVAVYEAVENGQDFVFLDCNTALEKIEGIKKQDLLGKRVTEVFPGVKDLGLFEVFQRVYHTGKSEYLPSSLYKDNRITGWRENWVYRLPNGNLVAVYNDVTERKKAEDALRESEERFRSLYNAVSAGVVVQDKTGKIVEANDVACEILGLTKDQMLGRTSTDPRWHAIREDGTPFPGEEHPAMITLQTGKPLRNIVMGIFNPQKNEYRWIQINSEPVINANTTEIIGVMTSFVDITTHKAIESALRASEEKYRKLINGMNDTVWVINFEGKFIDVNDAAVEHLGYSREELLQIGPQDIDTKLSKEQIDALIANLSADKRQVFETAHRRKDGKIIPVEISSSIITYQDKKAILSIARDITERKRLQEIDRAFRELSTQLLSPASIEEISKLILKYAQHFTQSPHGFVGYIDRKTGHFVTSALSGEAMSLCRMQDPSLVFTEYRGLWGWSIKTRQAFFSNTPKADPRAIGIPEGHLPIDRFLSVPTIFDGQIVGLIALANSNREYTEEDVKIIEQLSSLYAIALHRKEIESKLQEYASTLEEKVSERTKQLEEANQRLLKIERLAAIGELAGMVGHDLRNPLTSIKNAAYYLKMKGNTLPEESRRKMLDIIDSAIAHADKIISDLQEYSREIYLEFNRCTPKALLKEALSLVHIPSKIKLIDETRNEPLFQADNAKMVRVFANIIKNAVEAMPEGGILHVKSTKANDNVEISFTDTGIGISKETLPKLFSPLVTTKAQGMGFGLAICKRIIDAHGGTIIVQTEEGKGSTFTVTIPKEPKNKPEDQATWINLPES
ncbi:MAG: PAS domain S-box protein [Candidatus Bathyarchaeia archaeon]